ncbi:IS110 family transposase [Vibrio campbellii]|uniref:IS110 family transposase n=1 Tax=Vibrio campbellii TaxID=680 RepID=UPI00249AD47C|nr:IS110 family transposase [Vibrio campbellii]
MKKSTTIAIDLAKHSFQVCKLQGSSDEFNKAFTREKLKAWLIQQPPTTVVMEACSTAHYWGRFCCNHGHSVRLIAPKYVTAYRTGQKTDKNDATAIAVASQQANARFVALKSIDEQALQSIDRIRQHLTDSMTATSNMVRTLLSEFGFNIPKGHSAFKRHIIEILEDGQNALPDILREHVANAFHLHETLAKKRADLETSLTQHLKHHDACRKLEALEGVGPVNALGLYLSLGANGGNFKNGREASACIGLTPKQHSTGGRVTLLGISKKVGQKKLRSSLIQGALAVAKVVDKREPRNVKETWLKSLIQRAGLMKAAVALANKTTRTAWALLHYGSEYQAPLTYE